MNYNPFSLASKTILVTGASSGIGRCIAVECSKMGASIVIIGRNLDRLNETLAEMHGNNHSILSVDLTEKEKVSSFVDQLPELDGIVHSAGITNKVPAKFITAQKIDEIFSTNYHAPVLLTQSLLKNKKIRKQSSIVFISSIASFYASASNALYSSSKGALNSYLRVLALELAPRQIRVNGIQPGIVRTEMLEQFPFQEDLANHEKMYPLGRFGKPEDIAYAAVYLLSDASNWVTGSNFIIDGGVTLK
jgi:NAD(P)-dependent dehydrogenase (short-subunit alcohol dehydrogenase family)